MSILLFAIVGAIAQLIDGTLGMAFGITSSSLLVIAGATPLAASAAVHFAELGTTFSSGAAHWRAGNVDWHIVRRLGLPGAVGAAIGSTVLSRFSLEGSRMWMAGLLFVLGLILIVRFGLKVRVISALGTRPSSQVLIPLGLSAGFIDASGGGGWGPITTPTLLAITTHEPRKVIGTVSASEFFVAFAASGGFIAGSATSEMDWKVVAGLLLGGVLMAPFAAFLAGRLPHAPFGTLIGGIVVLSNGRILLRGFGASNLVVGVCALIVGLCVVVLAFSAWKREDREGVEHSFFEENEL